MRVIECSKVTLRLGVFFDGTGNNRVNSQCDGSATSNIAKLYELYRDQACERVQVGQVSVSLGIYLEGIGTCAGEADSPLSKATGRYGAGVLARAQQAPAAIIAKLRRWSEANPSVLIQKIELDIFGFSRGAAAARHFANDIVMGSASGLAQAWPAQLNRRVEGFDWQAPAHLAINFIGLFDTVGAIVSVLQGNFSPSNANHSGVHMGLTPTMARKIVHLVARDEHRNNFPLTQAPHDIVVPGAHSDVGGGYSPKMREQRVLCRPVSSVEPRTLANERSQAHLKAQDHCLRHQAAWQRLKLNVDICTEATNLPFVVKRDIVAQKQVLSYVRGSREVEGDLALVYLRIMRALAVEHDVPFVALDEQRFALAQPLQVIAGKLLAYASGEQAAPRLDDNEEALLSERYIHLSSDWSVAGAAREGVAAIYVNRPHESGQRSVFPNP